MNPDKYQQAWKSDAAQMNVTIDTDPLTAEVQHFHQNFRSMIFWRDVREAGTSLVLIPILFAMGFAISLPWTFYLTIPALIWVAGFILIDRRRHPQRPSPPGEPLLYYVKESLTQVEHQIWLLRNVIWWYILPGFISIMAFFLHVAWTSSSDWWEFIVFGGTSSLFLLVVDWGIYYVNQYAVREQLEPRRQDLLKVVASLDGETSDDEAGDLMELVSALNKPAAADVTWESWAENWDVQVPSWSAVAAIVLPTLAGALCGLYSGLVLQIPEMGPTLFQTVVAAAIPFLVSSTWFGWRNLMKHKQEQSEVMDDKPDVSAMDVEVDDATNEEPRRLPKSPALVIFVLTVCIGIMAFVALYSFFSHVRDTLGASAAQGYQLLSEPEFRDVSAFSEDQVAQVDAWLQTQVELAKYPSLTAAIVRDGKIVYGRAFGFANVANGTQATLQTQYHVASVTKAFTATLAVLLHEQGVVDLDQPAVKYLPGGVSISTTPKLGATITLRQLASHTSGLPRGVPGRVQSAEGWYELEPQRLYDHLRDVKLESDPGTEEVYSNLAFGLLGHVLELAADKPLDQLLQQMICDPLALEQTALQVDDKLQPATGYDDSGSAVERTHSFRERLAASGGLVTSAEDLAKFLVAQMEPGVFSPEVLKVLHKRTWTSTRSVTGTALGWSLGWNSSVGRTLKKNGGRVNCSAWIGCSPEYKTGVVVVTNCGGPDVDRIGSWLLQRSAPGGYRLVSKHGDITDYARVSPYSGVRWENDRPIVRVDDDKWFPLVSINDIGVDRIMEFANTEYGEKAHQRFSEDLIRVLSEMGHEPEWEVALGLQQRNGQVEQRRVLMTTANCMQAWSYNYDNN